MNLHIFNNPEAYDIYHGFAEPDDVVLLIEDAVYLVLNRDLSQDRRIRILIDDAFQRGVEDTSSYSAISYPEWVALTAACERSISWAKP